jgi:FkbM family methyltransferase
MGVLSRLFLGRAEGKRRWQWLFERLHKAALRGMNMGPGDELAQSGEAQLVARVHEALAGHRGAVVLDVGANRGDYSALLARELADLEGLRLLAFEPSPSLRPGLRTRFPEGGPVTLMPFGLGEVDEERTLHVDVPGSGLGSVYDRKLEHRGTSLGRTEAIRLRRLDDVCREQGIERIDFLKLDVEGHELAVLRGAGALLSEGRIDRIQFEFGGCHLDARVFLRDFWELLAPRYALYRVLKDGLRPVAKYRERLEVFVTTNYYAERVR